MDAVNEQKQKKAMLYGIISLLVLLQIYMCVLKRIICFLIGTTKLNGTFIFFQETFFWFLLLFIWLYSLKIEKQSLLIWPETQYGIGMHLKSILAIFAMIIVIAYPVTLVLEHFHLVKESTKVMELKTILQANRPLLLFAALTAGVTEEFIVRGYLLPRLEVFFKNPYIAIIVSSVLFGLLHIGYGTVSQVVGPLIIGLVLGYYYWRYRNIAIAIICHFLWDFMSLSLPIKPH